MTKIYISFKILLKNNDLNIAKVILVIACSIGVYNFRKNSVSSKIDQSKNILRIKTFKNIEPHQNYWFYPKMFNTAILSLYLHILFCYIYIPHFLLKSILLCQTVPGFSTCRNVQLSCSQSIAIY